MRAGSPLQARRVPPARGAADSLVVLVHGYGADANDLIALAPYWQDLLPGAAFVAPNAPEPTPMGFGYQWFAITRLDPAEFAHGVAAAVPLLDAFIDDELARLDVSPARLALVGFSQGTMMALHAGLRRDPPPAAIVGYSGALAAPERLQAEIAGRPPVLLIHGDSDDMIPVAAMHAAAAALGAAEVPVRFHVARGVGHSIDPEGLALGGQFLADALGFRAV